MKPEQSEQLFIEELIQKSIAAKKITNQSISLIDKLTGDASTRRYYRVVMNDKTSFVVCLDNPVKEELENNFFKFQKFLYQKNVRVPKIYDFIPSKGYLLEEDLGDTTLLVHLANLSKPDEIEETYKKIIDQLILMHKIDISQMEWINLKFDFAKLMDEMNFTLKYFIKMYLKNEDLELEKKLQNELIPICLRLSEQKMVFTHRDFHSRNIMALKDEMVIIDFQDARHGIPQYDLTSLLEDCYYDFSPLMRERLIKYYYDFSGIKNIQPSYDQFRDLYSDMTIQRVFKAIGSFAYIYASREDKRYLKYIGFAMEKLKLVMLNNPKYHTLYKELFGLYYAS
jgi:aminoglycoside/choline kinase family phosphotransferase